MKMLETIEGIELITTKACNMRCTYCYENKAKNSMFTKETANSILDLIRNNDKITYIDFFGGESLLPELKEHIMNFLKELATIRRNLKFYITTNALEVDKMYDVIDYIKDTFESLSIQISLDGGKQAHDICRIDTNKEGTFDRVFQNAINLFEIYKESENVRFNIHHVVSLQNAQYLIDTVCFDNMLKKHYPDVHISYNSEHSINTKPHDPSILIEALEFLHNIYMQFDLHFEIWCEFLHIEDYFQTRHAKCNLMDKFMNVSPDGDVSPCHYFWKQHGHNFYNINTKELDIDKYNKSLEFIKDNKAVSELGYDCDTCPSKGFCSYCAASSWVSTGYTNNTIVGSTVCSYARTVGEWVINKYNDGRYEELSDEEKQKLLDKFQEVIDKFDKDKTVENLRDFLFYRIKCKLNGIYESKEV